MELRVARFGDGGESVGMGVTMGCGACPPVTMSGAEGASERSVGDAFVMAFGALLCPPVEGTGGTAGEVLEALDQAQDALP